ncbi:MAG TPA: T9SS type A sorting domain-containing protein [Patescibacteria group bacterium]|nr:T9SS type A sorting domain-containing protein [Patescibacteria group bacterium]
MKKLLLSLATFVCAAVAAYAQPSSVTLVAPNGPATLRAGTSVDIRWVATDWGTVKTANWRFQYRDNINADWVDLKDRNGSVYVRASDTSAGGAATFAGGFRVPGQSTFTGYVRVVLQNADGTLNTTISDDNDVPFTIQQPETTKIDSVLKGNITGTVTLSSSKIYGLDGYVFVEDGATLRIEPGTIVVGGQVGTNSALCINRGGKIYAKGTKLRPIIFTSSAKPGERAAGDWGGILMCGRARINTAGGEAALEGGIAEPSSSSTKRGWYGGNDDNDSSGVLEYVRIEFAGIAAFANEELNSLTMGGVGRRTVLNYIQCSYGNDDAFEWFGGTVNAKHLIAIATLDDDFDADFGYSGKVQFALSQRHRQTADASTSQTFESDNNGTGTEATPYTQALFSNVTAIGPVQDTSWTTGTAANQFNRNFGAAAQIRRNSRLSIFNSLFVGWPAGIEILNNTARAAMNDSMQLRNNTWIGVKRVWRSNPPANTITTAWIETPAFGNFVLNQAGNLTSWSGLELPFVFDSPTFNPKPTPDAQFLNNLTSFVQTNMAVPIADPFFEKVSYRGAFDPNEERWDMGWTEYDPKNAVYTALSAIPTGVTLVSPKGGDVLTVGQTASLKWITNWGTNTSANFKFQFGQTATGPWTDIVVNGITLTASATSAHDTATFAGFVVPNTPTTSGFIRVVLLNADNTVNEMISDANDAAFEIKAAAQPTVTLISPKGGDVLRAGTSVDISWNATYADGQTSSLWRFQFSDGANGPWQDLKDRNGKIYVRSSNAGTGSFAAGFRVPAVQTTNGFLRIVRANPADSSLDITMMDMNDAPFTIIRPEAVVADSVLEGSITGNISLVNTKIYALKGYVYVENGATLNIQPGTIILGDQVGENSALCINRGGKIYAKGTRQLPIIFTSSARPGERAAGDWGGILICGRATINSPGGEASLEGGIADAAKVKGWYGGNDDNDSSGVLEYVRIEFAGIAAFANEELNSLTLGGVGSRTVINHVQASYNNDDAFEWFGGTVNAKHIIAYRTLDDDFDTDFGFRGKVQFAIAKRDPKVADQSTSQHFESDNNSQGTEATPYTHPIFSNITGIGPVEDMTWTSGNNQYSSRFGSAIQIRRNSRMSLFNSVFVGWPSGIQILNNSTRAALNDSLQVKNNSWFGVKTVWGGTAPADNVQSLLTNSAAANEVIMSTGNPNNDAKLVNPFLMYDNSELGFDPRPQADANFLNTASFIKTGNIVAIDDEFFEKVSYRGAFATGGEVSARWDKGWTHYDPVNAVYAAQKPLGIAEDIAAAETLTIGAYPNPAQVTTTISYYLPTSGNVTIRVFDALGTLNSTYIENVHQLDGYYDFNLNTSNLANGMYFVQVITPTGIATQSVNVLR